MSEEVKKRKRKNWSKEDEELLIQFEKEGRPTEYMMEYFNRTYNSIESKLDKIHARTRDRSGEPPSAGKAWTTEQKQELAKLVDQGKSVEELAKYFGRTEQAIVIKVNRIGKKILSINREWTPEEDAEFSEDWQDGAVSVSMMCKKYTRTWYGLRKRAQVLSLGPRPYNMEYVSVQDICEEMQVSEDRVYSWFKLGLKRRKNRSGKTTYVVDVDVLLKFLETHQDHFQADKISIYLFHDEPQWLIDKRKRDSGINISNRRLQYTNEEDKRIEMMFCRGKSDEEIAKALNRTADGIKYHRMALGLVKNVYMEYELDILRKHSDYKTIDELAKMLPLRTPKGIANKCEKLGLKYHYSKDACKKEDTS